MKPMLVMLSGERAGSRHSLEPGRRYILGRDDQADISLPEKKISRRHATLYWNTDSSQVLLEDLNSLNGTYVNQDIITSVVTLQDGDRIQIGSFLMEIKIPEESVIVDLSDALPAQTSPRLRNTEPKQLSDEEDSMDKTGGRLISGKLQELSLPDLLQMLATTRKTGRLLLSKNKIVSAPHPSMTMGRETGSLYLNNGELVHVDFNGLINEEAFFELLRWDKGYFALFPHRDFDFAEVVQMPVEGLLLEGFRRIDEQRANRVEINADDVFDVKLDEPLTNLAPDELLVFQTTWKHKTASRIWQKCGLEKDIINDILKSLMAKGFITRES